MSSPLDVYLPLAGADATERHVVVVRASAAAVWRALHTADLGGPAARALIALRTLRAPRATTLADVRRGGFATLGESAGWWIVLGLTGRFWRPSGCLVPTDPRTWRTGPPPGAAQAAWSVELSALDDGRTQLATETRVRCADPAARRAFRAYWLVVRPFSGLLRRLMLRSIRRAAERA